MNTARLSEWKGKQLVFGQALDELSVLFTDARFSFMPLKGAYLIATGLAASIDHRKMVDLDLLLPDAQFEEICCWFKGISGVTEKPNYWDFERSFVYICTSFPVYIEFHRMVNFPARFLLEADVLFKRSPSPSLSGCQLPDPVDALLVHCCHTIAHVIDGFELQVYRETPLYAGQHGFSWDHFWERARMTGILPYIVLFIRTCNRLLGTSFPVARHNHFYAQLIDNCNMFMAFKNPLLRKLLFEVPFVRNPAWLLLYKIRHQKKN